jgi:hypothetical protein
MSEFFDHITFSLDLPFIFYLTMIIWLVFQNWIIVLWVPGNTTLCLDDTLLNIALTIFNITCWVPLDASSATLSMRLITFTAISVVSLGFTAGLVLSFLKTRRLAKSLLFISRVMIEIVPCLMTYPMAAALGLYFADGPRTDSLMNFIFAILALLQLISFVTIFCLATTFWGATPYLPKMPFAAFDIAPHNKHTMEIFIPFFCRLLRQRSRSGLFTWLLDLRTACAPGEAMPGSTISRLVKDCHNDLTSSRKGTVRLELPGKLARHSS